MATYKKSKSSQSKNKPFIRKLIGNSYNPKINYFVKIS